MDFSTDWAANALSLAGHNEILLIIPVVVLSFVSCTALALLFIYWRNSLGKKRSLNTEETEILEKLWDGIQKMDERMTNLETIILESKRERDRSER